MGIDLMVSGLVRPGKKLELWCKAVPWNSKHYLKTNPGSIPAIPSLIFLVEFRTSGLAGAERPI